MDALLQGEETLPTATLRISAPSLASVDHLASLTELLSTHLLLRPTERKWWSILIEIDFRFPRSANIVRRFAVTIRDIPCLAKEFDGPLLASEVIRLCEVIHNPLLLVDFSHLRVEIYCAIALFHGGAVDFEIRDHLAQHTFGHVSRSPLLHSVRMGIYTAVDLVDIVDEGVIITHTLTLSFQLQSEEAHGGIPHLLFVITLLSLSLPRTLLVVQITLLADHIVTCRFAILLCFLMVTRMLRLLRPQIFQNPVNSVVEGPEGVPASAISAHVALEHKLTDISIIREA